MKRMIIAPHMRCNARCAHCCVASNPKDQRRLNDEDVYRLVEEAILHPEIEYVSFTGGEAMLRREFMLDLISRVSTAGKKTTLVSNGFWGVTPRLALNRLIELHSAGLNLLTLSADTFHLPYVPLQRIKNILDVWPKVPRIQINLNICESRSNKADKILELLGDSVKNVRVTRFPITPVGTAEQIPKEEIEFNALSTDTLRCPGQTLLFSSDDNAYPCCSTGVMNSALSVGRASKLSIEEAANRIQKNLLFHIISKEGLGWIVDRCKEQGIEKFQEPFEVVDSCHLCCEIFSDIKNLEKIHPVLIEYRRQYLAKTNRRMI